VDESLSANGGVGRRVPSDQVGKPLALTMLVLFGLASILWTGRSAIAEVVSTRWEELVVWAVLLALANLPHFESESTQFTLDHPLLLAVGMLYPAPLAALVASVGSIDVREISGRVSLTKGLYNRAQIGISVYLASTVFQVVTSLDAPWPVAIGGAILANCCFYGVNVLFVAAHVTVRGDVHRPSLFSQLLVGSPIEFFSVYLFFGVLGLVLATLFTEVGSWAVALFTVPIAVAHTALVRAERMAALAARLRQRERLLESLSDTIVEERRDERLRIAGDLHDDVVQSLVRLRQLGGFLLQAKPTNEQARLDAEEVVSLSEQTLTNMRQVLSDLRDSPVGRGGLLPTLRNLARDFQLQSRLPVRFQADADAAIASETQLVVYQVAKEAILNAVKHADASGIEVKLAVSSTDVRLTVSDDGTGFNPEAVDESRHFGLGLMRERLRIAGGSLEIESNEHGTRVTATLPKSRPAVTLGEQTTG
jgi:signal transduction histidine kinase